jgi:hypothetical protein
MSCQSKSRGRPQRRFLRHHGIYRSDVSLPLFTPGSVPLSGRAGGQGIGHAGKNMSCPSSAMSSGRLFLDRVARLQSPSPLHRQCQDKALAASGQSVYHRTVDSVLTGCLTRGGHPRSLPHPFEAPRALKPSKEKPCGNHRLKQKHAPNQYERPALAYDSCAARRGSNANNENISLF